MDWSLVTTSSWFSLIDSSLVYQVASTTSPGSSSSGFWELTVVGTISEASGSLLTYTVQKDFTAVLGLPIFTPGDVQTAQILARAFNILDTQLAPGVAGTAGIQSATVATDQSTTSGTYVDLTTPGPSVTVLVPGTSVLCLISAEVYISSGAPQSGYIGVAVSGATTIAPTVNNAFANILDNNYGNVLSRSFLITGLNPGTNTFKLQYLSGIGGAVHFLQRDLTIIPLDTAPNGAPIASSPAAGIALTSGQGNYVITTIPTQSGPPYAFRVVPTIENLIDSSPTVINAVVTAKTGTGATLSFAPLPDSANFILRYAVYAT